MLARRRLALLVVPFASLAVAACGCSKSGGPSIGSQPTGGAGSPTAGGAGGSDAASLVPAKYKSAGTLTVAADASYAPNEFIAKDGKTVVGMDADLAKAIGEKLGLQVKVVNATFNTILAGINADRYQLGMSSFTDTKAREKQVDFVTYFNAGTSFFEKNGGPTVNTLDDLCGLTVSVESGTTQETDANAQSKKCTDAGKKAVTVSAFPDQSKANLALSSGRAQVSMADSPVAAYQVKQSNGAFALVGQPYGQAPYGIAMAKNGLAPAVQAALKELIADGTYTQILTTWGIQDGAITDPVINGAQS